MSNVIRSLVVKIGADLSAFEKGMRKAQKTLKDAGRNIGSIGETFTKNVTTPIVAVGTALAAMTLNAASAADDLNDLSSVTGISTTQLQEMSYAGTILGTDLDTMTGAQTKLTRSIYEALNGNKEAIKSFQELGISIYDSHGKIKDANTIFWEVLDALGKIEDPVMRDGLAMQLMGKSAQELNPLIKAGSDEIQKMMKAADDLGLVLGEEQVKQLADLNDAWDTVKLQFAAAGSAIAAQLAPYLMDLFKALSDNIPKVVDFLKGLIDKFLELDPGTQKFILSLVGVVAAIGPLLAVAGVLVTAIGAIATPVGLVVAAIIGLIAIGTLLVVNWDTICQWFTELMANTWANIKLNIEVVWGAIKTFFTTVWEGIKNIAVTVFNGIKDFFVQWGPTILAIITGPIGMLVLAVTKNWDAIKEATSTAFNTVKDVVSSIWNGIVGTIRGAVNTVSSIVGGMVSAVTDAINTVTSLINKIPGINIPKIEAPKIIPHGEGGIFTQPTLWGNNLIAENGPEALVPLDRLGDLNRPTTIQVILDGRVIQEYIDNGLGNGLVAFGGA